MAQIAVADPLPVEAAHEQRVAIADTCDPALDRVQPASPREPEQAMLDPGQVPALRFLAELGHPQRVLGFDHGLGARSAHRCACEKKLAGAVGHGPGHFELVGQEGACSGLKPRQVDHRVAAPPGPRRLQLPAEPERARAVVRPRHQVVEFLQDRPAGAPLDEQASPVVRHGVPNDAEESSHAPRPVHALGEPQFHGIEFDGIRATEIAPAIDEFAQRRSRAGFRDAEPARNGERRLPRQNDEDPYSSRTSFLPTSLLGSAFGLGMYLSIHPPSQLAM